MLAAPRRGIEPRSPARHPSNLEVPEIGVFLSSISESLQSILKGALSNPALLLLLATILMNDTPIGTACKQSELENHVPDSVKIRG